MLKVLLPSTKQSFYTKPQADAFLERFADLRSRFGAMVDHVAGLCYIPTWAMYAKMLLENAGGNATAISSSGAIGLMQIKPLSATDMITLERRARRLTKEEDAELKRLLPAKFTSLANSQMGNQIITSGDLKRPEVNLLIGALHMSTLIAEHTVNDLVRMDLVGLRYNQGYYYRRSALSSFTGNTDELLATLSGEARDYVLKLCGLNGMLDIVT